MVKWNIKVRRLVPGAPEGSHRAVKSRGGYRTGHSGQPNPRGGLKTGPVPPGGSKSTETNEFTKKQRDLNHSYTDLPRGGG